MKGEPDEKKAILLQLASLLEPRRKILEEIDKKLANNLFFMFNNVQIRHNNCDSTDKGKYREVVDKMSSDELEQWYDETYQMCLLAFLEIDNIDRSERVDKLKEQINNTK